MKKIGLFLIVIIIIIVTGGLFMYQKRDIIISQNEQSLAKMGIESKKIDELLSPMKPKEAQTKIQEINELFSKISKELGIKEHGIQNWLKEVDSIDEADEILKKQYQSLNDEFSAKISASEKVLAENNLKYTKKENETLIETYLQEQYLLIANNVRDTCYNQEYDGVLIANKSNCLSPDFVSDLQTKAQKQTDKMIADAKKDGIVLTKISEHRSYEYQVNLFNSYIDSMGYETATSVSAWPGASEHQTGLAVDFGSVNGTCNLESCYESTPEGKWLLNNAANYGFILRYPDGDRKITGYSYEPWHYRYVGKDIAKSIMSESITLEEYLGIDYPIY